MWLVFALSSSLAFGILYWVCKVRNKKMSRETTLSDMDVETGGVERDNSSTVDEAFRFLDDYSPEK